MQQRCDQRCVDGGVFNAFADIGRSDGVEPLRIHGAQIKGVKMLQLCQVKDGGGFGNAGDVEGLNQLLQRKDFLFSQLTPGTPAQQRHVVQHGFGEISLCDQILIRRIAVPFGHFILRVAHHRMKFLQR